MEKQNKNTPGNVIYISHGGGPMPILGDPGHDKMTQFMKSLPETLQKPDEILVISAHWEENAATVIGSLNPPLLYDYYGFPDASYDLNYPVKGSPSLADSIMNLLAENGISSKSTTERGLDHGLFIPLIMMYPEADIPVTELSLIRGLDPAEHIKMGKALQSLTEKNILIIGSGFSFHNMGAFSMKGSENTDPSNDDFQDWLIDTCCGSYSNDDREELLVHWSKAPSARYCHPREEHLIPLHVCSALAGTKANVIFDDYILGKRAVAFQW